MPAWTILPPNKENLDQDYCHPILMKLFRVMKTIYRLLDPQNEPSRVHEGKHIAIFGYADSEEMSESSVLSSLFHISTQTSPRFALLSRDMQIEDRVQNLHIPVPLELVPVVTNICNFALARSQISGDTDEPECDVAHQVWQRVQIQKYHERLLKSGSTDSPDDDPQCTLSIESQSMRDLSDSYVSFDRLHRMYPACYALAAVCRRTLLV
ncbi:uncharacterized protein EDB91DRAFT_865479 [Suillus paluster]|uniref:uncharacterized protein n=1 Tax=Suillus paluster TaxID=48578 RepID=UPI001B87BDAD|nr:uncharacterized protein EDB91DRAFT_865479 [Suillus paluster]KAG1728149.1 hypothetical protein EDB91DRAFT_865479 [Suillus paluster]